MRWIDITKILDVTGLQNGIKDTLKSLKNKQNEIKDVEKAVKGILTLEDAFKGKSGDALRDFYKEVHIPFMSYYQDFIKDYESKLDIMDKELLALESASDGRIVEEFLTGELKNSLQKTANHTITLTDDTNDTILSVQDIVALPQLSDASFLEEVNDAKKQINDTVEKVHQFDYNQTEALEQLSKDVSNMQNYINGIKSLTNSGKLQLENYASGTLNKYQLDDWLTDVGGTCPRADTEEVDKIEELKEKLLKASSVDEYLKIAEELGDANLDEDQKQFITMLKTAKGIKDGLYESGKDFVVGIFDAVRHPVKTVESTIQAIAHPIETYDYISKSISDSFVRDVINGDAESRARWMSYAFGTVVTSVVGTKGAGAVTKAGMATTKAAAKAGVSTVKGALKETSIPNLFPYAPQHQLAGVNVGGVPYNTVDSVGLRDRLLSVAKVETKGSGKGAKGTGEGSKHLSDVKIPSVRNKEFNKWFDNLSAKEFEEMWNNPQLRSKIEDRIRRPGGYHEWHLVSRTPKFKQWGISMDDIKEMRSLTKDVEFVNPPGRHGSRGSTKAHNEILKIIDSASDYGSFVKGLNEWAENRMKNGIMDLPEDLRR
ncbi:ribonuclease YeeF family protein [Rummeliibacillus pycnus]|uniref:ribonuclease YeeF family protein n=1 Tax=Rummeliibacillus pycnus TaxID=101070 RepID=UPI0037C6C6DF